MITIYNHTADEDAIRAGCAEAKFWREYVEQGKCDAIRAGCAEAKKSKYDSEHAAFEMQSVRDVLRQRLSGHRRLSLPPMQSVRDVLRQSTRCCDNGGNSRDAIRAGCAEAKMFPLESHPPTIRCNPCGMFQIKREVIVFKLS